MMSSEDSVSCQNRKRGRNRRNVSSDSPSWLFSADAQPQLETFHFNWSGLGTRVNMVLKAPRVILRVTGAKDD